MSESFETPSRSSVAVNDGSAASRARVERTALSLAHRFHLRTLTQAAAIESKARGSSGLAARVVSAAIAAPLVAGLTVAGGWWFVVLVLIVALLSSLELASLLRRAQIPASSAVTVVASWSFPLAAALNDTSFGIGLLGLTIAGGLLSLARTVPAASATGEDASAGTPGSSSMALAGWGLSIATGLYVGALLAPSIGLREHANGLWWVALILGATWGFDIAAYFVGRQWGSHKIAPAISPQKSAEGTLAGLIAAVLICVVGGTLMAESAPRFVGLGIVIAAGALLGDLAESVLKRLLAAKDSGWIMPGHGGLLDRIDSLMLAAFLACWYIALTDRFAAQ